MAATARRYDLDWLRIGATLLLFPYHVAKTFDVTPIYHVKNAVLVPQLDYVTLFIHQWHMPLFFALAGWSAYGSLASRGSGGFMRERVQRVLVPFVAGCVVLCPFVKYLELRSGLSVTAQGVGTLTAPFDESFLRFLPTFFTRLDRFTWSHLWFLIYLFAFTLVLLPALAPLAARGARDAAGGRGAQPPGWRLYLPLVPFVLIQTTLRLRWHGIQNLYDDWANVAYYGLFFLLGFCVSRRPAWEDVIAREWRRAGAIGLGAAAAMLAGWWLRGGVHWPIELTRPALATGLPLLALSGVTGYCVVIAIVGAARQHLTGAALNDAPRVRDARRYLTEAALPIYVLHQLAVVALGYVVVGLAVSIPVKMALQLTGAVAATFAAYHYGVRRVPAARALLGMKGGVPATALRTPVNTAQAAC
jgi:hypothetical protein